MLEIGKQKIRYKSNDFVQKNIRAAGKVLAQLVLTMGRPLPLDKAIGYILSTTDGTQAAYIILKAFDFADSDNIVAVVDRASVDTLGDFPRP